jgi:hypothetical protein
MDNSLVPFVFRSGIGSYLGPFYVCVFAAFLNVISLVLQGSTPPFKEIGGHGAKHIGYSSELP